MQDPHLTLAYNGKADFRGHNNTCYNFVSSPGVSLNVRTTDAKFRLRQLTVEGSFITEVYIVMVTEKGRYFNVSYDAQQLNSQGFSWTGIRGSCARPENRGPFILRPHAKKICDDMTAMVDYATLKIYGASWYFEVRGRNVYNRIEGPHHRLDLHMKTSANLEQMRPHGIIGQSFDGTHIPRIGRTDYYPDRSKPGFVRTTAMAEGVIEGDASQYIVNSSFGTQFAYSRFDAKRYYAALSNSVSASSTEEEEEEERPPDA